MVYNNTKYLKMKECACKNFEEELGLNYSIVLGIEKCSKNDYIYECDEIDEEGKVHIAKNKSMKFIEEHNEIVLASKITEGYCPKCGICSESVHDYRVRYIQDSKRNGIPTYYKLVYKRFECKECGCEFAENNPDFPKGQKTTDSLKNDIMEELKENVSRTTIARNNFVSQNYVKRVLDSMDFSRKELGEAIGIDEFKGNMEYKATDGNVYKNKYQVVIKNLETGEIIDILPNRYIFTLINYFSKIPLEERKKVKYFTCDMNPYFIKMAKVYFPNAKIIVDRFHYTEAVVRAFETLRLEAQKKLTDEQRIKFKRSRFVLLRNEKKMKKDKTDYGEYVYKLDEIFEICPELRKPYLLLQEFYEMKECVDKECARIKLMQFYKKVEEYNNESFNRAVKTLKNHEKYIINSYEIKEYTNAYVEGTNNLIKVLKRVSYGLKNLERFKKRLNMIVNNYIEQRKEKEQKIEIIKLRKEHRENIKKIKEGKLQVA